MMLLFSFILLILFVLKFYCVSEVSKNSWIYSINVSLLPEHNPVFWTKSFNYHFIYANIILHPCVGRKLKKKQVLKTVEYRNATNVTSVNRIYWCIRLVFPLTSYIVESNFFYFDALSRTVEQVFSIFNIQFIRTLSFRRTVDKRTSSRLWWVWKINTMNTCENLLIEINYDYFIYFQIAINVDVRTNYCVLLLLWVMGFLLNVFGVFFFLKNNFFSEVG